MYQYKLIKSGGGGMFRAGLIDQDRCQAVLDAMPQAGWRLVSSFVEMQDGNSMNMCTIWEREVSGAVQQQSEEEQYIAKGWVNCGHGHYYSPQAYKSCPLCAKQAP
jgi:hypothetical protein